MSPRSLFLMPGDIYFGNGYQGVKTLLGSCVAITLWHPQRRIGGMCHFALPRRDRVAHGQLDGRYGEEAMEYFMQQLARYGSPAREFTAGIFGGGDMFGNISPSCGTPLNIGARNIEMARRLSRQLGFRVGSEDVGGNSYRQLALDLTNGGLQLRREPVGAAQRLDEVMRVSA